MKVFRQYQKNTNLHVERNRIFAIESFAEGQSLKSASQKLITTNKEENYEKYMEGAKYEYLKRDYIKYNDLRGSYVESLSVRTGLMNQTKIVKMCLKDIKRMIL